MREQKYLIIAALLLMAMPLAAQDVVSGGDDGWTTPGGGQTQVDLSSYPVGQALGSNPTSNSISLKGKPLDSANLGSIDTIVARPSSITISGGTGTGNLQIKALSLESVGDIVLADGRHFTLRVCLSNSASSTGSITLARTNSDGGTFNSTLPVLPKLIFTPVGGGSAVVIDCGTGACAESDMSSSNTGWVNTGGSGGFNPAAKGVTPIRAGIWVDGDCDGVKDDYQTIGKGTGKKLYGGFTASAPSFPVVGVGEQHEDLSWHQPLPPLDCVAGSTTTDTTTSSATAKIVANPAPAPVLCPVVANPVNPVN
jgi:hypothetical protein